MRQKLVKQGGFQTWIRLGKRSSGNLEYGAANARLVRALKAAARVDEAVSCLTAWNRPWCAANAIFPSIADRVVKPLQENLSLKATNAFEVSHEQ